METNIEDLSHAILLSIIFLSYLRQVPACCEAIRSQLYKGDYFEPKS